MYKVPTYAKTKIKGRELPEGESIETKVERITSNKEPIKDGAPEIFTERKDGVLPGFNIRTDRFEIAVEATDLISKSKIAKREGLHIVKDEPNTNEGNENNQPAGGEGGA